MVLRACCVIDAMLFREQRTNEVCSLHRRRSVMPGRAMFRRRGPVVHMCLWSVVICLLILVVKRISEARRSRRFRLAGVIGSLVLASRLRARFRMGIAGMVFRLPVQIALRWVGIFTACWCHMFLG